MKHQRINCLYNVNVSERKQVNLNRLGGYDRRVIEYLDEIQPEIWKNLAIVPSLPGAVARDVLVYFVKLACTPQNTRPIMIGREAIVEMPKGWVLQHIEGIASDHINLEDDWEFRRLCELYALLDRNLLNRLVAAGLKSSAPGVVGAAVDFSGR